MKPNPRVLPALLVLFSAAFLVSADEEATQESGGRAVLLEIRGAIGPATSDYVIRGIDKAAEGGARLIVLEMDTPGGLVSSTREINKAILRSSVPVATFVYPSGSQAASAGTYILYASHVAAMAPATNLGAATPVSLAPAGDDKEQKTDDDEAESGDEATDEGDQPLEPNKKDAETGDVVDSETAMRRKVVNDAVAYIRSLAELRDRNADWAEEAVRSGVSISAERALEINVIDLVASDLGDMLEQSHGRIVSVNNTDTSLETIGLVLERQEPDWRTRFLAVITDPNIAYLLMLIGIYGLLYEGYNPGAIVPGVVGAICLILAGFAFQLLPVNYAGLFLIVLGVVLMIAEVFAPSFGALGIGGVIAFVLGSIILIKTDVPGFGISLPVITSMATVGGGTILAIVWFAVRARRAPVVSGREQLIGSIGTARQRFRGDGTIFVHGEIWQARTKSPVAKGQRVRVLAIDGLVLSVEPLSE